LFWRGIGGEFGIGSVFGRARMREIQILCKTNYWRIRMSKGWTPERRAQQAAAIQRWQPWAQSTGPRSLEGKARAARNADKGGEWRETRALIREMNQLMRQQQEALGEVEDWLF
jgi:hypothetical protein